MKSALAVANEFLRIAREEGRRIDPLKLQKLLYFAQGWSLALRDKALFEDSITAWRHGPVVEPVYQAFRRYGAGPIAEAATQIPFWGGEIETITDADEKAFIKEVWDTHKHLSGVELSTLSHKEPHPWVKIKAEYGDRMERENPVITQEAMRKSFEAMEDDGTTAE